MHLIKLMLISFLAICPTLAMAQEIALESVVLTDVIKSSGSTGPQPIALHLDEALGATVSERIALLEQLRSTSSDADGNSVLTFGVDINEAADGTEKSESQAIALAFVEITATIGGEVRSYTSFVTETQTLLTTDAEADRQPYYTLLGDTGSNRITGSTILNKFDSTLRVRIPDSLATATAVTLEIRLLDTNVALGDPEAFYDYSNGFEDLALLTQPDAEALDQLEPGRDEAPMVIETNPPDPTAVTSWQSYPSANGYYLVGYEDLYPRNGDYDFNDLTVAYQVQMGLNEDNQLIVITGKAFIITRGAGFTHDWHLRLGLPATASGTLTRSLYTYSEQPLADGSNALPIVQNQLSGFTGELDVRAFADTRQLFPAGPEAGCDFVNTEIGCSFVRGPRFEFRVDFDVPVNSEQVAAAPFDPYLFVYGSDTNGTTQYEVHLQNQSLATNRTLQGYAPSDNAQDGLTTFTDERGFPFAMLMPDAWFPPYERIDLAVAYPDFVNFVLSGGTQNTDWYIAPVPSQVRGISRSEWEW